MKSPPPIQRTRSRALRRNQTDAEHRLWTYLRNRQIAGAKFRRQVPIGPYIADFCCLEVGLVIELDGGQHAERATHDEARMRSLEAEGFVVMRFWNNQFLSDTESAVEQIQKAIEQQRKLGRRYGAPLLARMGEDRGEGD